MSQRLAKSGDTEKQFWLSGFLGPGNTALPVFHFPLHGVSQRSRRRLYVLLTLLEVRVELLDPRRQCAHLALHAAELRAHYVVQLVLYDLQLHGGIRAKHGGTEGQSWIIGRPADGKDTLDRGVLKMHFGRWAPLM